MINSGIQTTAKLNVHDKVYADFSKYGRIAVREGKVIKKTPTGVAQVEFTDGLILSFMPGGHQRGAGYADRAQLITIERYHNQRVRMELSKREREAADAVLAARNIAATVGNKAELIEALRVALAKVEAI
jgi:hypothetical protein